MKAYTGTKFLVIIFLVCFFGCSPTSKKIQFGTDQCAHCKMTISDSKFGAELVTDKGKIYMFDSIECMIAFFTKSEQEVAHSFKYFWTIDYSNQGELLDAKNALYLKDDNFNSPMGMNVASFKDISSMQKFKKKESFQLKYLEVIDIVKKEWGL